MFLLQTFTLSSSMHLKIIKLERFCMQKQPTPTKGHVELDYMLQPKPDLSLKEVHCVKMATATWDSMDLRYH